MKNGSFEDLLVELRRSDVPALPGSFPSDVLREIRLRRLSKEAERDAGWLPALLSLFRPSLLVASLSVAIVVGVVMPGLVRPADQSSDISDLDLNVFSTSSPNFPSGLLAKSR
jgi:hypothetical protein